MGFSSCYHPFRRGSRLSCFIFSYRAFIRGQSDRPPASLEECQSSPGMVNPILLWHVVLHFHVLPVRLPFSLRSVD